MAMDVRDNELKEEHLQLAAIIKGVHNQLRCEYKANSQCFDQVWQRHTQNHSTLHLYADAMHRLATEHWTVNPKTRIDWCRQVAIEYFHQNGLFVALQKDEKRRYHERLRAIERDKTSPQLRDMSSVSTGVVASSIKSLSECGATQPDYLLPVASVPSINEVQNKAVICPPLAGRVRLLDVGSCYNPFLGFDEFDVVSVDLSPAKQTVLQCDFLELRISTQPPPFNPLTFDIQALNSPLQELPGCSFHVVVFSLLLEYLPSASQRWRCCMKAFSLLAVNGLLLVVTPDSHSQHRNAPMMKCWKNAIESLGFQRWKYEKQDHIHCMAFRKVTWKSKVAETVLADGTQTTSAIDMLYIPQDFSDACYGHAGPRQVAGQESQADSQDFIRLAMEELPLFSFKES